MVKSYSTKVARDGPGCKKKLNREYLSVTRIKITKSNSYENNGLHAKKLQTMIYKIYGAFKMWVYHKAEEFKTTNLGLVVHFEANQSWIYMVQKLV